MSVPPADRRRPRWRRWAAIVVGAYLGAALVAVASDRSASTTSTIDVYLDPVEVSSLFDPPDTVRDPEADLQAQVATVTSAELDALVEAEVGRPVSITAEDVVVEEGRLTLAVDAGSAVPSMEAAEAAGDALLELRARSGIAQAQGGLAAIEANVARLQDERTGAVDSEQLATIDQTIADQEAASGQLEGAVARLTEEPNGSVGGRTDPRVGQAVLPRAGLTFGVLVVLGLLGSWWWRRRFGPVRDGAPTVAGRPATQVGDEHQLHALVLDARLVSSGAAGTLLVVLGTDDAIATEVARQIAAAAPSGTAALVDAAQEGDVDLAALAEGAVLPSAPGSRPMVVGLSDEVDGAIATRRTASALDLLCGTHELVVVAGGAATTQVALAWSAHADAVLLPAVAGQTTQRQLRAAFEWLDRHGVEARPVVLSPSLVAGAAPAATPLVVTP